MTTVVVYKTDTKEVLAENKFMLKMEDKNNEK